MRAADPQSDDIVIRIDPPRRRDLLEASSRLRIRCSSRPESLFQESLGDGPALEMLLGYALAGDPEHFARRHVEETGGSGPLLDDPSEIETYEPGVAGARPAPRN